MQLRVARLCLDCEELYAGDSCPVCASDRYAFLSTWLPSEERRRWRRPVPQPPAGVTGQLRVWMRRMAGLFGAEVPPEPHVGPRTRASDFVPRLDFDEPGKTPTPSPALEPMRDARRVTTGGDR